MLICLLSHSRSKMRFGIDEQKFIAIRKWKRKRLKRFFCFFFPPLSVCNHIPIAYLLLFDCHRPFIEQWIFGIRKRKEWIEFSTFLQLCISFSFSLFLWHWFAAKIQSRRRETLKLKNKTLNDVPRTKKFRFQFVSSLLWHRTNYLFDILTSTKTEKPWKCKKKEREKRKQMRRSLLYCDGVKEANERIRRRQKNEIRLHWNISMLIFLHLCLYLGSVDEKFSFFSLHFLEKMTEISLA